MLLPRIRPIIFSDASRLRVARRVAWSNPAGSVLFWVVVSIDLYWKRDGDLIQVSEQTHPEQNVVTLDPSRGEVQIRGKKYELVHAVPPPEGRACSADRDVRLVWNGDVRCLVAFSPRDGDGIYVRGRMCGPDFYRDPGRKDVWFVEYDEGRKRADWRESKITLLDEMEPSLEGLEIVVALLLWRYL